MSYLLVARAELVRCVFAALATGDVEPFRELLDPDADRVAVPQGDEVADTPRGASRRAIIDRLARLHSARRWVATPGRGRFVAS